MIVGTCSFGSTGSSAVTDYLHEFQGLQVLDKIEFTWVSRVDGLIDLDYHLFNTHNRTEDSVKAIARYKELAEACIFYYKKAGKADSKAMRDSVERFLESITQVKWYWEYERPKDVFLKYISALYERIIPKLEIKKGCQINCWPMKEACLSVSPEHFEEAAKAHVRELLTAIGAEHDRMVVLDQPFAGNNPQACFKYFEEPYAIVVDRDPRDNYVFANTKLLGQNHFMAVTPVEDFVKYYRSLRKSQPYTRQDSRVLSIKFEDMVFHYDETTKKIRKFLNLGENPAPKSIFDPAISMPNTRVWLRYPQYAKDIEYIERELPEYLFDYSGCPEPDLKGEMFFGKSPKNK